MIIIAGSGMSAGGRILFHEKFYLPDPKSCLLITNFQVRGTPGRQIIEGNKSVPPGSIFRDQPNSIWLDYVPAKVNEGQFQLDAVRLYNLLGCDRTKLYENMAEFTTALRLYSQGIL